MFFQNMPFWIDPIRTNNPTQTTKAIHRPLLDGDCISLPSAEEDEEDQNGQKINN